MTFDSEELVRQGQDRLKQIMPSGSPRGIIILAVLVLAGLASVALWWRRLFPRPEAPR